MSGSVTAVVSSQLPTQLPVLRCPLPSAATALADSRLSAGAPPSTETLSNGNTFGTVLSAKISRQSADSRTSAVPCARPGATASEMVSSKNAGTSKSQHDKQNGGDLVPPQGVTVAGTLPTAPLSAPTQGNFCLREEDTSAACTGASENSVEPANANAGASALSEGCGPLEPATAQSYLAVGTEVPCLPQTLATNSLTEAQAHAAVRNAPEANTQNIPSADDSANRSCLPAGDESQCAALPSHGLFASKPEPSPSQTAENGSAPSWNMAPRNPQTSGSPATSQRSGEAEDPAVKKLATADLVVMSNVSSHAAETLPAKATLPPVDAATRRNSPATGCSQEANPSARKQGTSGSKPQPVENPQADSQAQQSMIAALPSPKAQEPRPVTLIPTHDGPSQTATSGNAVLPLGGHASPSADGPASVRPQAAPAGPDPSLAENSQASSVVIHNARVLERIGQSEMRLGLNSDNFGSIELHTRVSQNRVGACVVTTHTDLRAAMMAEIPSLERAIAQHQLRLDSFNLDLRSGAEGSNHDGSAQNQPGARSSTTPGAEISECNEDSTAQEGSLPQAWTSPYSSGLSIHA